MTDNILMYVRVCVANTEHAIGKILFVKALGADSIRYC